MSVYRCCICEDYCDTDERGCCAHPTIETECICEDCDTEHSTSQLIDIILDIKEEENDKARGCS